MGRRCKTTIPGRATGVRLDFQTFDKESMNPKIVIRNETDVEVSAIAEVTVAAFRTLEISNHTEQIIIAALRAAKALTVSLVAEANDRVIGHIVFSPVTISDGSRNWYGLGPVSALPAHQQQGSKFARTKCAQGGTP